MKLPKLSRTPSGPAPPSPTSPSKSVAAQKGQLDRGKSGQFCVPLPRHRSRTLDADSSEITDAASPAPTTLTDQIDRSFRDIPPVVLQEMKQVFRQFDSNNDGKISAAELRSVLRCLGDGITHKEAEQMVREVASDGNGFINLSEFLDLNTKGLRVTGEVASIDELRAAFDMFDLDKDGHITARELHTVLTSLGDERCSVEDCKRMIEGVDRKGLGLVDLDDFKVMMTSASFACEFENKSSY